MTVRLKLAILIGSALGVSSAILGTVIYIVLAGTLYGEIDKGLASRADSVLKSIKISTQFPFALQEIILPDVDVLSSPGIYLQVVDVSGRTVAKSRNLGGQSLPLNEQTLRSSYKGDSFYETVNAGGTHLRIYNQSLVAGNNIAGILQVGRSLSDIEAVLIRLKLFFLGGVVLFIVSAGLLGWTLAGAALKPVQRVITVASEIEKGSDLGRRIEYSGPGDEMGKLVQTLNSMLDRLEGAYRELKESNEAQRRFVADASHELRTPLTTIRGNAELLLKMGEKDPATRIEALGDIVAEAQRLSRMVEGLLMLARADSGGFQVEMMPVKVQELLEEVARGARLLAGEVSFNYSPAPEGINRGGTALGGKEASLTVLANADLLRQLLLILLDNAFKYTPAGGTVTLGVYPALWGHQEAVNIYVSDTGPGISPGQEPHVFERFYRGDRARGESGTGLGLAIARWIVDQHQGEIKLETALGKGSTFTAVLPALRGSGLTY